MKRYTLAILVMLFVAAAAVLLVWSLPAVVRALPGQVRIRLPEEILRAVTTPLPTALPAPSIVADDIQLTAESIIANPVEASTATAVLPTPPPSSPTSTRSAGTLAPTPTLAPTKEPPTATPTTIPLPVTVQLQGMEIEPQKMNNCGPTNLTINLNYYGSGATQQEVASVIKPHYDDRNVSPDELVGYTNEYTPLRASLFSGGDLLLLKQLLAAGFPVVIEKGYEPDWQGWMGHYLTLIGYDDADESFLTMDTFLGPWDSSGRAYSYEEIRENWQHFNNTFFVVYPVEREEEFQQIIDPELTDPFMMWQHAAREAQMDIDADSENPFAWFNLGSSYTTLGDLTGDSQYFEAAAAAFDQARLIGLPTRMLWYQFKLYEAYLAVGRFDDVLTLTATIRDHQGGDKVEETFYYRGLALQDYGNEQDAAYNFRRALEIRPGYAEAQNALDRLTQD